MTKVLVFVGRQHHAQKLQSIASELQRREIEVRYVNSNNATNSDPSSEYIWDFTTQPLHLYDYFNHHSVEQVDRLVAGLSQYSAGYKLLESIAPFWTTFSIREACELVIGWESLIQIEKPDAVIGLHSNNAFFRPLLYTAHSKGIKTFCTQEGLLRHRDQQTQNKQSSAVDYVNTLFTWSESDRSSYLNAGVDSKTIVPVGPFHLDDQIKVRNSTEFTQRQAQFKHSFGFKFDKPLVSFMPPVSNRYQGDFSRALVELSKYCTENLIQLMIRLHPFDYPIRNEVKKLLKPYKVQYYEHDNGNWLTLFSDAVITQNSTSAYESLFLMTPVIELDLDRIGITESIANQSLATLIEDGELSKINDVLNGKFETESLNQWRLLNSNLADGNSTNRAVDYILGAIR